MEDSFTQAVPQSQLNTVFCFQGGPSRWQQYLLVKADHRQMLFYVIYSVASCPEKRGHIAQRSNCCLVSSVDRDVTKKIYPGPLRLQIFCEDFLNIIHCSVSVSFN